MTIVLVNCVTELWVLSEDVQKMWVCQHSIMDGRETHKTLPIPEELQAVNDCWKRWYNFLQSYDHW